MRKNSRNKSSFSRRGNKLGKWLILGTVQRNREICFWTCCSLCLRFLVEYQALDSDIQMTILHRLHVCKMDIQSACRGKSPNPFEMHIEQSVEQENSNINILVNL